MHVAKFNKGSAKRIIAHVERDRKTLTDSEIDWSKTHLNVELVERMKADELRQLEGLAKRKDAVTLVDTVLTLPEELKYASREKQIAFFRCALVALQKHIGGQVAFATIHFDETTPHLHFGVVPITRDGRLCAKEIVNRSMLTGLHGTVEKAVRENGFNVQLQEPDEELRKVQHDLGYSKKSMKEYRKDATRDALEAQYDRETEKTIEYHQRAMKHGKKTVKRRKGESKEEYKARKTEMVEVPKAHYDALMALDFDRETVQKGAEAEYALQEATAKESTIKGEIRLIQGLAKEEQRKIDGIDAEIERRAEQKALERRADRLDEMTDFLGKLSINGTNGLDYFEKQRTEKAPKMQKSKGFDWER